MNKKLILCAAFLVAAVANAFACTNLIVGKNASADGSTIVPIRRELCSMSMSGIPVNISERLNRHARPTMSLVI